MAKKKTDTAPQNGNQKKSSAKFLKDVRYGRALSIDFFRRNAWLLLVIMVAVLSLMGLRYKTKTKMAEIKKLEATLERAESSKLQEKSAYMSLIREAEMRRLVNEKGLGLIFREQPPYEIVIKEKP